MNKGFVSDAQRKAVMAKQRSERLKTAATIVGGGLLVAAAATAPGRRILRGAGKRTVTTAQKVRKNKLVSAWRSSAQTRKRAVVATRKVLPENLYLMKEKYFPSEKKKRK